MTKEGSVLYNVPMSVRIGKPKMCFELEKLENNVNSETKPVTQTEISKTVEPVKETVSRGTIFNEWD